MGFFNKKMENNERLEIERKEIDVLIEKGFLVKTPITSIFKFGKNFRTWRVSRLPLGLMDLQTDLFFQLSVDEQKMYSQNPNERNNEIINSVKSDGKIASEVVAISILGSRWKIKLFRKIFANYLFWRINSKELLEFTLKIYKMNDYQNFMTSIILMKAKRTSLPIKKNPEATRASMME